MTTNKDKDTLIREALEKAIEVFHKEPKFDQLVRAIEARNACQTAIALLSAPSVDRGMEPEAFTLSLKDAVMLWHLLPEWVRYHKTGLTPMDYGTMSAEGDAQVRRDVIRALGLGRINATVTTHGEVSEETKTALLNVITLAYAHEEKASAPVGGQPLQEVAEWCEKTFGPITATRLAERAQEEMDELLAETRATEAWTPAATEEAADVVIILSRVPGLMEAIAAKMEVNKKREWNFLGDGTGYRANKAAAPPKALHYRWNKEGSYGELYELLCKGGEALGKFNHGVGPGWGAYWMAGPVRIAPKGLMAYGNILLDLRDEPQQAFIAECTRLNLHWISAEEEVGEPVAYTTELALETSAQLAGTIHGTIDASVRNIWGDKGVGLYRHAPRSQGVSAKEVMEVLNECRVPPYKNAFNVDVFRARLSHLFKDTDNP